MSNHIEIGNIRPRVRYVANGTNREFSFPFPIFEPTDINVYLNDVLINSGFSVEDAGKSEGGKIVFKTEPAQETVVTILRNLEIKRTTDFQEGGAFRAKVINHELDYQTACIQQLEENFKRAVMLAPYAADHNLSLPLPEKGKALIWDPDGNGLSNSTVKPDDLENTCKEYCNQAQNAAETAINVADGMEDLLQQTTNKASDAATSALEAAESAIRAENNFHGFLGSVMFAARTDVPENHLPADGQVWTSAQFPDFYNHLLSGREKTVSFEQWSALSEANDGNVGCYGLDIENQKFRMIALSDTLLRATTENSETGMSTPHVSGVDAENPACRETAYRAFVQVYTGVVDPSLLSAAELMSKFAECCSIDAHNLTTEGKDRLITLGIPDYRTIEEIKYTLNTPILADDHLCLIAVATSGGSAINVSLCDSLGNLISPRSILTAHTGANTLTATNGFVKKGEYFMVVKAVGAATFFKTYLYGEN